MFFCFQVPPLLGAGLKGNHGKPRPFWGGAPKKIRLYIFLVGVKHSFGPKKDQSSVSSFPPSPDYSPGRKIHPPAGHLEHPPSYVELLAQSPWERCQMD